MQIDAIKLTCVILIVVIAIAVYAYLRAGSVKKLVKQMENVVDADTKDGTEPFSDNVMRYRSGDALIPAPETSAELQSTIEEEPGVTITPELSDFNGKMDYESYLIEQTDAVTSSAHVAGLSQKYAPKNSDDISAIISDQSVRNKSLSELQKHQRAVMVSSGTEILTKPRPRYVNGMSRRSVDGGSLANTTFLESAESAEDLGGDITEGDLGEIVTSSQINKPSRVVI